MVGPTAVLGGSVSWGELVSRGKTADVHRAHGRIVAIELVAPAFDRARGVVERSPRVAPAAAHPG